MISVIITTYMRNIVMLMRAINSVLSQTVNDFELIIVDDSPSDYCERENIKSHIKSLDNKKIYYVQHQKNMGASAARNTGIDLAKGDFIAFLDDDDEWLPQKLEMQLKEIIKKNAGLVYCNHYNISPNGKRRLIRHKSPKSANIVDELLIDNFIGSTSFPLIRSECFKKCGNFDVDLLSSQDLEMWIRICKNFTISHIEQPLVNYYVHENEQITSNPDKKIQATKVLNVRYKENIYNNKLLYKIRTLKLAHYFFMAGKTREAISLWIKALSIKPSKIDLNAKYFVLMYKFHRNKNRV